MLICNYLILRINWQTQKQNISKETTILKSKAFNDTSNGHILNYKILEGSHEDDYHQYIDAQSSNMVASGEYEFSGNEASFLQLKY